MKFDRTSRTKVLETFVVLIGACLVIYLIKEVKLVIYLGIGLAFIGLFVPKLARWIHYLWFKLADILGFFMSRLILSVVFFLLLSPIALLYRIVGKDPLKLKKPEKTNWSERNSMYQAKDLENPW